MAGRGTRSGAGRGRGRVVVERNEILMAAAMQVCVWWAGRVYRLVLNSHIACLHWSEPGFKGCIAIYKKFMHMNKQSK